MITTRIALNTDIEEIQSLYRNTVLVINRRNYSQEEVEDWASCGDDLSKLESMIKTHYFIVAVNQQLQIVGFSSITPQGYLHSMFVHKDFQGEGVATLLLKEIERYAVTAGITRITSEVSITARPFFEKRGYAVEVEQKRRANQLSLTNYWMAKSLVWWENQIDPSIVFGIPQVGCMDMRGQYAENHQLSPDIEVYNTPEKALAGEDQQLEAAVQEMLKTIGEKK